jgi:hypothetical protein
MTVPDFAERLRELTRRPLVLLAWMLAANAVTWPYLGFVHDARLYSGQVLYRLDPETFGGDLFFQFGSQDRYSLFSPIMAPLVKLVGFDVGFFAYYLVALPLLLFGVQRLALRLVPDSPGVVLGLLFVSMMPLSYGGHNIFRVIEPFSTPRLLASALTLFALTWTLEGRPIRAAAGFVGALALHPLMAFPGVVLAVAYGIWQRFGGRVFAVAATISAIAAIVVFAVPTIGGPLFGVMDDEWKDIVQLTCPYQFPQVWTGHDWFWAALVLGGAGAAACWLRPDPAKARFVTLATILGFLGLIVTVVMVRLPFALPIMAQPYRAMWIVTALMPPLVFAFAGHLWLTQRVTMRWAALAILILLGLTFEWRVEIGLLLVIVPASVIMARIFGRELPTAVRWAAIPAGAAIGVLGLWGVKRIAQLLGGPLELLLLLDPLIGYEYFPIVAGPVLLLLIAVAAMWLTGRHLTRPATGCVLVAIALAWDGVFFTAPRVAPTDAMIDPYRPGIHFVADSLRDKEPSRPLQIYSNLRRVEFVWMDWHARSYFDVNQTAGFIFTKSTAVEGMRRGQLAGPFEVDCVRNRRDVMPEAIVKGSEALFHFDMDSPLRKEHLLRLAADPLLDYIVLWDLASDSELLAHATATGPRVAIFDARKLRAERSSDSTE